MKNPAIQQCSEDLREVASPSRRIWAWLPIRRTISCSRPQTRRVIANVTAALDGTDNQAIAKPNVEQAVVTGY